MNTSEIFDTPMTARQFNRMQWDLYGTCAKALWEGKAFTCPWQFLIIPYLGD